jgi:hypothetical protein
MSDIHIYIEREQPVKVITLEPSGKRGPAGPNSVTSATSSDGTCDLELDTLVVGTGTASGIHSVALGQSTASGDLSFAQGLSTASNDYAFASGDGSTASGYGSFAINNSTASGDLSFAAGGGTTASGDYSLALGFSSVAMEIHSAAIGRRAKSIHAGASVESDSQDADVESAAINEKTFRFANGYRFLGGTASFTAVVAPSEVKSANFTAENGGGYIAVATLTVTDPTPSEGAGYTVFIRNGTATVGGTAYSTAGSLIRRVFHSGSWQNYEYKNHAQYGNLATVNGGTGVATSLAVNTGSAGAFVVNGGTATDMTLAGSAAFTSTTRPTSAGTGTPAATSLITRDDGDARCERIHTTTILRGQSRANGADFLSTQTTYEGTPHTMVGFLPKKIILRAIIRFTTTPTNAEAANFAGVFGDFNPSNANMSATTLRTMSCTSVIKASGQNNYVITCEMTESEISTIFASQFSTYGALDFSFARLRNLTNETLTTEASLAAGVISLEIYR